MFLVSAIAASYEGANLALTALRLLFDYSEAQKTRAEKVADRRLEERVKELERRVAELGEGSS